MSTSEPTYQANVADLLRDGIAAVKAREFEKARALLMQVIDRDERNEQAWLWLSGAVETDADRRVCLENVLAINPGNAAAQRGLAKLGPAPTQAQPDSAARTVVMRREHAPISPAAAILYPDKQAHEWSWTETPDLKRVASIEYQAASSFNDIWNTNKDVCGYCAQEVSEEDRACPRCQRSLISTRYRLDQAGADLYVLGVLVLSLGLQFGFQVFLDVVTPAFALIAFDGLLALSLLVLAAGIYLRQRWAYHGALVTMSVALAGATIRLIIGLTSKDNPGEIPLLAWVVQCATATLALFVAVVWANNDFELAEVRQVMRIGSDLRLAGDHFHTGKSYADKGLWAMAVPYWQRATATNPSNAYYRRMLGEAYARLGFAERSLDMLQSALRVTNNPAMQSEIEQLIESVRQQ
ncbi:MAG TPA: tetratricopeptide repeat protein [Anaerolineae bacterium]